MNRHDKISRRTFLKTGITVGAGLYGLSYLSTMKKKPNLKKQKEHQLKPGLVVAYGNVTDPIKEVTVIKEMVRRAMNALGGMNKLVSKGNRVVIKPNIAWNQKPEFAANTNPFVVAALVELCREAGASVVKVMDHTCSANPEPSYVNSGIATAAHQSGAEVIYLNKSRFKDFTIPDGKILKSWYFYEEMVYANEVDVLINVPIAKQHGTSRLSMGLKNVFGMIGGDRGSLHTNIHPKIADLNKFVKIDLTVLDAFRILKNHGPTGGRLDDVDNSADHARRIIIGTDPVAVDAYGTSLFSIQPKDIGYIRESHEQRLGEIDYRLKGFEEIRV
ncbi:MAG: DUF362 domain-containing protein [Candidatus Jettenia sp.]|uniref:DUF362 domain-containing protein n=1 Tax=Candidatus Jettenia caeni TaxID=247490 RepID=I3IQP7_9BACT|nr:DUF362 domain-containing protein [Candidatus Jettenia sp. AMX1]MBC6929977.1 DUF362 domain-containing protein [Candidatus Jettenia sp.]WKZ15353.1 MAG: DUF362 domain-containing protein [Candidatus Jettenia caeni]KAA0248463.1 MAG: DUF362 domain-containing protein [Candidatus Jettenia sp. AMX1]MCE7881716.1 DUF362 domain-containing protein [Candidatus Jettenia sp. AMX1]MCQ3928257.1 DUF362 domain-containing protein [Candidatus Jettenia sp.]